MKRSNWAGLLAGMVAILAGFLLVGCDPQPGDGCATPGSTWAKGGRVLHCVDSGHGPVWSKLPGSKSMPGLPRPAPQPRAR